MMTKSAVNLSLRIATQFPPSNQCGRLAQAQLIYLRKMSDFFFLVKVRKIDEDESQMDDDEKNLS